MLPPDQGGVGRITIGSSGIVFITQVGMWFGYVSFGFITDAIGRKRAFVTFLLVASALLPIYGFTKNPYALLGLGPSVAFFGTGYFSGFGVLTAEIYPKSIRATAQGVNLQYRPNRRRGGAFHRRVAGGHARIRRRVRHHRRGVPAGRRCLDLDS